MKYLYHSRLYRADGRARRARPLAELVSCRERSLTGIPRAT